MSIYSIIILTSIIIGFTFIYVNLRINKIPKNIIGYMLLLSITCIIYFSKLVTVLTSDDLSVNIFTAGLSSLGAAIGLLLSVLIFTKIYKEKTKEIYEIFSIVLPLMYGISKIGCHFAGCCYGIPYDGIFYTTSKFEKTYDKLFPIQLVESTIFLIIFIINIFMYYNKVRINYLAVEMIMCAVAKFMLDYLRYSNIDKIITINQVICSIFLIIGALILINNKYKNNGVNDTKDDYCNHFVDKQNILNNKEEK